MANHHEECQASIVENIQKLITALTGFEATDENFSACEQFSHSILRNHRSISTNSHEIRRQMEGLFDKFRFDNHAAFADKLRLLYEHHVNDPVWQDHYQIDIQWSIVKLLLELAQRPVGRLEERLLDGEELCLDPASAVVAPTRDLEKEELISLLREENIRVEPTTPRRGADDSDLSDWSGDDDVASTVASGSFNSTVVGDVTLAPEPKAVVVFTEVQPPVRQPHHRPFDATNSEEWLLNNVQSAWWSNKDAICPVASFHEGATFCDFWQQHGQRNSFTKPDKVSTVSEYRLLRECLFMFVEATSCKFFRLEDDEVMLNANVSIPSTTVEGLHLFLAQVTPYMTIMHRLRKFCKIVLVNAASATSPPHTFESYASAVSDYLDEVAEFVVGEERQVRAQAKGESYTLVLLFNRFAGHFEVLKHLWDIHTHSVLDWNKFPAHVCAAHLLAGIFSRIRNSANAMRANMALSIYLNTIRVYLMIVDVWWTEGRLDDWRGEFLVERVEDETAGVKFVGRLMRSSKEHGFFLSEKIAKVLEVDPIIQLLLRHSLDAGFTLNILASLDRINELKIRSAETLYDLLMSRVCDEFEKLREPTANPGAGTDPPPTVEKTPNQKISAEVRSKILEMGDELLLMAFESSLQIAERQDAGTEEVLTSKSKHKYSAYRLYQQFTSITDLMLPAENLISRILLNILEVKISAANIFVRTIYKEEYHVLDHLRSIRKVLLLEASDMMHYFYTDLFRQIEGGGNWANPYLLTVQLNDIWSSYHPHSVGQSLFSLTIDSNFNRDTTKVLEAIDKLTVGYNINTHLANVIDATIMGRYNKIFRFLVKVKWGLWTLENLRFPSIYRHRRPYAELQMIDLILRRLAIQRIWMMYSIQCVHSHLMTQVLQALGAQLDVNIEAASNLSEMVRTHASYIQTVHDHCFQNAEEKTILDGVMQLLQLSHVLRDEWETVCLINEMDEGGHFGDDEKLNELIENSQVDAIEKTYIGCHQYLVDTLNREVYQKHKAHLAGLCAAFTSSVPY